MGYNYVKTFEKKFILNSIAQLCIIIVDLQEGESRQRLGVIVDAVNEVLEFPGEQIEPAPQFGAGLRTEFIRGMGKVANQFIVLLEMARVLSMDEMAELAAIAAGATAGA